MLFSYQFFIILINQINKLEPTELFHKNQIHELFDQTANIQLMDPENDQFLTSIGFPFTPQEYLVLMFRFNEDSSMFILRVLTDVSF